MSTANYYDAFADHQAQVGINARHRAIDRWLATFGLVPGMNVLEIGCGIGTQTELIAKRLHGSGTITAVDVSPRSIEFARARLSGHANVRFLAGDVVELRFEQRFDVVVMPDVIEHIPLEDHKRLFANVRSWLEESGWVLINMPNPFYLDWCRRHRPEVLQVIDQPIFTDALVANTQPNDLYVHYLSTYSVWIAECDYQVIVLRPVPRAPFETPVVDESLRAKLATAPNRIPGFRWLRGRIETKLGHR